VFQLIEQRIQQAFGHYLESKFGITTPVGLEQPKQPEFGEAAVPVAFQLARQLKKPPKAIASELVAGVGPIEGVASLEVAGNGYINVRFDRGAYGASLLNPPKPQAAQDGKVIVEHTNINPNKAAHIGHLRNAILGDTFVRMQRAIGRTVEVQNYIDNTGVQVADVVVGFHFLEKIPIAEVRRLIEHPERPFDYVCWDLYARISSYYKDSPEALAWRAETIHAIEEGHGEVAEMGHLIADAIVSRHLKTMLRLGVVYDVLPRESEILHLKFWATAFEQLKERKAIYLETEGKNKGCWVMPGSAFSSDSDDPDSKVIVRSNGTVTYVGKDIAYQMWKFGLLGKDFYYKRLMTYPNGHDLWVSTGEPQDNPASFGKGSQVFNVIDSRQSYLQDVVVAGLRALGYNDQAERSVHFSYEMVALTPRACIELNIPISEEDKKKPYIEVAGRKGIGVKADDLIDKLIEAALSVVESHEDNKDRAGNQTVAEQIAIGALRYFMLKYTRNTVIAFDMQEALALVGETGPYVQYAAVRAGRITTKLAERGDPLPDFDTLTAESFALQLKDEGLWQAVVSLSKVEQSIARAAELGEPAHVAKLAFQLAQGYSGFYESYNVLQEENPERRTLLLWLNLYFRRQLELVLNVLGIAVPEYM
jgi:arginyl-tRNA synthetase